MFTYFRNVLPLRRNMILYEEAKRVKNVGLICHLIQNKFYTKSQLKTILNDSLKEPPQVDIIKEIITHPKINFVDILSSNFFYDEVFVKDQWLLVKEIIDKKVNAVSELELLKKNISNNSYIDSKINEMNKIYKDSLTNIKVLGIIIVVGGGSFYYGSHMSK